MTRRRVGGLTFALVVTLVGCANARSAGETNNADASAVGAARPTMAVAGKPAPKHVTKPGVFVIDSDVGEVFEQAAATVRAPLSSDAAWRLFAGLNGSARRVPPHFVTVRLGYLTLPVGLGMPDTAHHELSWAYSWRQCMASRGLYVTTPPPPPRSCVSWLFLDGTTGAQIDMTQQH